MKAWIFYKLVQHVGHTAVYYGEGSQILPSYIAELQPSIRETRVQ